MVILMIILCCFSYTRPPEWWLIQKDGTFYLRIENEPVTLNDDWTRDCSDVSFYVYDANEVFQFIAKNWLSDDMPRTNLKAFAVLATGWPAKPLPPPPVPVCVDLWVNERTKVVHREGCRYINPLTYEHYCETDFITKRIISADYWEYRGCLVCRPSLYFMGE